MKVKHIIEYLESLPQHVDVTYFSIGKRLENVEAWINDNERYRRENKK